MALLHKVSAVLLLLWVIQRGQGFSMSGITDIAKSHADTAKSQFDNPMIINDKIDEVLDKYNSRAYKEIVLPTLHKSLAYGCLLEGPKQIRREGDATLDWKNKISRFAFTIEEMAISCSWKLEFVLFEWSGTVWAYSSSLTGLAEVNVNDGTEIIITISGMDDIETDIRGVMFLTHIMKWILSIKDVFSRSEIIKILVKFFFILLEACIDFFKNPLDEWRMG